MVTLEKLGILGIRSFSPESLEVLSFEKPLTLIVGHNGAGKTTIVECLKMAITGEFPPNANKGQNFIHNISSHEIPEVKGQIRLVFKAPNEEKILVNRSFQLSMSRDRKGRIKTSFKALESVLQVKDADGNVRSINKKCAQMDQHVSHLMGVCPAILDHVVFCHQEDSYWPLGDMSTLKKRFDEIFGATRYSKALGVLSTLRKEHQKIMKEKQQELTLKESLLNQANLLKQKIVETTQKNECLRVKSQSLIEELSRTKKSLAEAIKQLEVSREHEVKCNINKEELNRCRLTYETLRLEFSSSIQMYSDWNEGDLKAEMETLNQSLTSEKSQIDSLFYEITATETQLEDLTKRKNRINRHMEERIRLNERCKTIEERKKAIVEKLVDKTQEVSALSIGKIILIMRESYNLVKKEITTHEVDVEDKIKAKLLELENSTQRLSFLTESHTALQFNAKELQRSMVELENLISEQTIVEERLSLLESNIEDVDKRCTHVEVAEMELKLQELRKGRNDIQDQINGFVSDAISNGQDIEQGMQKTNAGLFFKLQSMCSDRYQELFLKDFPDIPDAFLEVEMDLIQLKQLDEDVHKTESCYMHCKGTLEGLQETILCIEEQCSLAHNSQNLCKDSDFSIALAEQKKVARMNLKQLLVTQCASKFYNNHLKQSIEKTICLFCMKPLQGTNDLENLESRVSNRVISLVAKIEEQGSSLAEEERKLEEMERNNNLNKIFSEISLLLEPLKKKTKETELKCSQLKLKLMSLTKKKDKTQERKEMLTHFYELLKLLKLVEKTISHHDIVQQDSHLEKEMSEQTTRKCSAFSSLHQNLVEKSNAIESLEASLVAARQVLEDARRERVLLQERKASYVEKQRTIKNALLRKPDVIKKLEQNRNEMQLLSQYIQEAKMTCSTLREEVQALRENSSEKRRQLHEKESSISRDLNDVTQLEKEWNYAQDALHSLDLLLSNEELESSSFDKTANLLSQLRRRLHEHETEVENLQQRLKSVEKALQLFNHQHTLQRLEQQVETLMAYLSEENHAPSKLNELVASYTTKVNTLSSQIGATMGEEKSNSDYQRQNEAELRSVHYRNIEKEYHDTLVDYETESMTVRDLQRYHTALDKALMKYHTLKMQAINQSMRELWQAIYKGKDIDFITIRSDTEEDLQVMTTGQRSYNYRVMMMKDGCHELEMRGRCSAGQKVLASIVVRLALAESFGVNCGVFALDEPTTNLDERNMQGLARALADLINFRKSCLNFQLILITHDENFVRMLARYQPCESFFQIIKNNSGYSCIRRADIHSF